MKNKILFLTDINKKIGTGHFMRSARMAKEFIKFKYKIYLISKTKKKMTKQNFLKRYIIFQVMIKFSI